MAIAEAPRRAIDRMRRPLRAGDVLVTLEDVLIVTWPVADLARHLPPPLQPRRDFGEPLLSVVLFRNRALRPAVFEVPRLGSYQLNVRSYVVDPVTGAPDSVFFHGLHLSRRWVAHVSSVLFGVPFRHLEFSLGSPAPGRWEARDGGGAVFLEAHEAGSSLDAEELDALTNPHTGYYLDRRGRLRSWSIWHPPQQVRAMRVTRHALPCMGELRVGAPRSALRVAAVDYEVYLRSRPVLAPR
jgi:hypothetical protein